MNIEKLIREYIAKVEVMQLATVKDGQPWACTVHFTPDENLNLYWFSTPDRRHSQEIETEKRVAAAIGVQTTSASPQLLVYRLKATPK